MTPTQLADKMLTAVFDADPLDATLNGFHERDERLPAFGAAAEQALRARFDEIRIEALGMDTTRSDLEARLTVAVVLQQAEAMIDRIDARSIEHGITGAFFAPVPDLLLRLSQVAVADAEQARSFLARLEALPTTLEDAADRHRSGIRSGRVPVRHLVETAVDHLDHYLAAPGTDPLLGPRMHDEELEAERERVLRAEVHPALRSYREVLAAEITPHGRTSDRAGLCWLPEGGEIYRLLIRAQTTTEKSPRELHDTGLALLDSIREECSELGGILFGTSDPVEAVHRVRSDPALRWRDAEEALTSGRMALERAEAVAGEWFGRVPARGCAVEELPGPGHEVAPPACYLPPALDGSRPGTYFINTHRIEERSRVTAEAITFHEAVPGHHFQLTSAQELTELPMLRRLVPVIAYSEGWGLYAERLADEMGLYSGDLARLGMVGQDALRAARLVVDTGVHEFGWSRRRAVDFLMANTPLPRLEAESEVDRYTAFPAQALAYMTGRLEFDRVRAASEQRWGEEFDVRAFHDVVLGHGALPLSTLDYLVTADPHPREGRENA